MGLMCLCLNFISILLSFPTLTSTNAHLALPRTLLAHHGNIGPITNMNPSSETVATSHGLTERAFFTLKATPSAGVTSSPSKCKQTYGVMPCTHSIVGNIFLLAAYGYILYRAAKFLSEGSELLLVVLSPGIIGGLLLPMVGVLPDTILVLVSGLGGSRAEAQEQVLVGIGLLAGSNVMLLTLLWGSCLFLGRCDLERTDQHGEIMITAKDKTLTRKFDLIGTGVETDNVTRVSARIMCVSVIPFIVAQLSQLPHFSDTRHISVLTACVLSIAGLVAYGMYQLIQPKIQECRILRAKKLYYKIILFQYFSQNLLLQRSGAVEDIKIVDREGKVNRGVVEKLFHTLDENKDDKVMKEEVRVALTVYRLNSELPADALDRFMKDFDTDRSGDISLDEFLSGMERWCKDIKLKPPQYSLEGQKQKVEALLEQLLQIEQEEREDEGEVKEKIIKKAVILLLGGTFMAVLFADPLVDAVTEFSSASHIPSFFVSFLLLPLASNSSEAVSSILFSSRKRKVNMSLTYSQIYGGVTMNNTMSLGIFLAVVYGRHLVWEFSSEVLIICLVTLIMGLTASIQKIFPLWMAGVALLLYPSSLALVSVLDYIAGWK